MNAYILIKRDGTRQEVPFLLVEKDILHHDVGDTTEKTYYVKEKVAYISDHISRAEFGQHDTGQVIIFEPLIQLFEAVRKAVGKPITINSGYRSPEYQEKLYAADQSGAVAKPGHSPHMHGVAMDLAIPAGWTAQSLAGLIQNTSVGLGFPRARTGWKMYNGRFVHADLVFMLFAPYTKTPNPEAAAWRPGVTW